MKTRCESKEVRAARSIELPVLANAPQAKSGVAHSKVSKWRAGALITLTLLMIAHIIQWKLMGETISPIEPSEAMYTLQRGAINAGLIFFSLAILATLIFGRFVCGWGCHIVALQDFSAWLLKKMGLTPRPFRSRLLMFVPLIVALYMFVWPTVVRYFAKPANEPLIPQFTNHIVTSNFWETFPPVFVAIPFLFIVGFMTVYFLGSKGFCTYACPYGGFFALADKVAPGKIRVTDACNECGHCTAVCTSNVIVHAEVKQYGMVVNPGCMKCMDCISVCPNDALYFGFGKPAIGVPKTLKTNYSLSWPEEIFGAVVFFISFMAAWDVYQLVPMLMALGIATVTTFLALRILRLFTSDNLAFYRFNLRSGGKLQKAGYGFLALSALWIGLNAHSGYIRYHERAGAIAFQSLTIPDELALARSDPRPWVNKADRKTIEDGRKHFAKAADAGLFTNTYAVSKLAWMEYLAGNTDRSIELLERAAEVQHGEGRALSLYYRGAILNRTAKYEQALASLDAALEERPDLILAREEKGESLWQLGRRQEAVTTWVDAVNQNPNLVIANNHLAGAATILGLTDEAAKYEQKANEATPNDPRFYWMVGLRLQNIGMRELAQKHFDRARQIDPSFETRLEWNTLKQN